MSRSWAFASQRGCGGRPKFPPAYAPVHLDETERWRRRTTSGPSRTPVFEKTLARISERDKPDGLFSIAQLPVWEPRSVRLDRSSLVMVADGMEIPGNLGTLIRTVDAAGADCLVLTNRRTRQTHPKVFRASQGMVLKTPVMARRTTGRSTTRVRAPHSSRLGALRNPETVVFSRLRARVHPDAGRDRLAQRVDLRRRPPLRSPRPEKPLVNTLADAFNLVITVGESPLADVERLAAWSKAPLKTSVRLGSAGSCAGQEVIAKSADFDAGRIDSGLIVCDS